MTPPPKILVVDDEASVRLVLNRFLTAAGYTVVECGDGCDTIASVEREAPALVVLDVEMPQLDGWKTLAMLRRHGHRLPVLMLTNTTDVSARVRGLEAGADDYLGKPCDFAELIARVRALLRRTQTLPASVARLRIGRTIVDLERKSARCGDAPLHLTRKEFATLELLAQYRGKPVSRDQILRDVWEINGSLNSHTLDTLIWRLRKKLGDGGGESRWIRNLPGMGFVLECEVERDPGPHG